MTQFDAQPIPRKLKPLQLSVPEVEAWLLAKSPQGIGRFDEMARDEYARAFTAAQTAGTDIADDLYFGLVDVVSRSGTQDDFAALVTPILKQKGWLQGDEGKIAKRVELIFDTNIRLGRAAGRWGRYQQTKAALPYVRGVTVGDERVRHPPKSPRSDHRAFEGIILPIDHPFVAEYWTPLGFRCRCIWVQMSRSQLARYPGGITTEAELDRRRAEIGPPMFASPVAPMSAQLSAMVEGTNADRMPGMPPVDTTQTRNAGVAVWQSIVADGAASALEKLLERLFA